MNNQFSNSYLNTNYKTSYQNNQPTKTPSSQFETYNPKFNDVTKNIGKMPSHESPTEYTNPTERVQKLSSDLRDIQEQHFLQQLEFAKLSKESSIRNEEIERRRKLLEEQEREIEAQKKELERQKQLIKENIEKEREKARHEIKKREMELKKLEQQINDTQIEMNESNEDTDKEDDEDKKIRESLYFYVIETTRNIAKNTQRISNLVSTSFDKLQISNSEEQSLLIFVIDYLDGLLHKLNSILESNILVIDDDIYAPVESNHKFLYSSTSDLIKLIRELLKPQQPSDKEQLKEKSLKSCEMVLFAIKRFVEELEGIKVSEILDPQSVNVLSSTSIEEAERIRENAMTVQKVSELTIESYEEDKLILPYFDHSQIDLSSYPVKYVQILQRLIRKWNKTYRFRSIVNRWKRSKKSLPLVKRYKVLFEILDTERSYNSSLKHCINTYYRSMVENSKSSSPIVTMNQINAIFGCLEKIIECSNGLLKDIEERLAKWPSNQIFSDVIIENVDKMTIYSDYINNYDLSTRIYSNLIGNPKFNEFMQTCKKNSGDIRDLPTLLIMPVQRMPRYQLLLGELIKYTDEEHIDRQNLIEAKKKIIAMNTEINKRKREFDNKMKIQSIMNDIRWPSKPLDLYKPERLFLKWSLAKIQKDDNKYYSIVFLFNDIIILTKCTKTNIRPPFDFMDKISLKNVGVHFHKSFMSKRTLRIWNKIGAKDIWYIKFANESICNAWFKDISEGIETASLRKLLAPSTNSNVENKLTILSATYGDLAKPHYCIDVASQLQYIVEMQGGKELNLAAGTKQNLPGFIDPAKGRKKNLIIIYSVSGIIKTKTFKDEDIVTLP